MNEHSSDRTKPSNLREDLSPYLTALLPNAYNAALQICFSYQLGHELREEHQNVEHVIRSLKEDTQEITQAWKRLKQLRSHVHKLERLLDAIVPQFGDIRARHIPAAEKPVEIIPGRDPVLRYFRQRGIPDPIDDLVNFCPMVRRMSGWLEQEIEFLKGKHETLWEADPVLFHRNGAAEYILEQIFTRYSQQRIKKQEIYERVRAILTYLDGGGRSPHAVRMATARVKRDLSLRDQCEKSIARSCPKTPSRN